MERRTNHREHDSHPTQIAFEERSDGLWWVSGTALTDFKRLVGLRCDGQSAGFEPGAVYSYSTQLAHRSVTITVLRPQGIVAIGAPKVCKPKPPASRSIFLAPDLLLDATEQARLEKSIPLNDALLTQLATQDLGRIYVYQVAETTCEIDWDLTGIPRASLEACLLACAQLGRNVRCRLVEPKPKRGRRSEPSELGAASVETKKQGQLRLVL